MRWRDPTQSNEPLNDQLAIEQAMARRLKRRGISRLLTLGLCVISALLIAGVLVYRDMQKPVALPSSQPVIPPLRPAPAPIVADKDQTKLTTTPNTENDPTAQSRTNSPATGTRQIELGQRPQAAPSEPAGNNEEPITLGTAPVPLPRLSP